LASPKVRDSATIVEPSRTTRRRVSGFSDLLSDQCCAVSIRTYETVIVAAKPSVAKDGSAAIAGFRSCVSADGSIADSCPWAQLKR